MVLELAGPEAGRGRCQSWRGRLRSGAAWRAGGSRWVLVDDSPGWPGGVRPPSSFDSSKRSYRIFERAGLESYRIFERAEGASLSFVLLGGGLVGFVETLLVCWVASGSTEGSAPRMIFFERFLGDGLGVSARLGLGEAGRGRSVMPVEALVLLVGSIFCAARGAFRVAGKAAGSWPSAG